MKNKTVIQFFKKILLVLLFLSPLIQNQISAQNTKKLLNHEYQNLGLPSKQIFQNIETAISYIIALPPHSRLLSINDIKKIILLGLPTLTPEEKGQLTRTVQQKLHQKESKCSHHQTSDDPRQKRYHRYKERLQNPNKKIFPIQKSKELIYQIILKFLKPGTFNLSPDIPVDNLNSQEIEKLALMLQQQLLG